MSLYICPVCRSPRKANFKDHIDFKVHLKILFCVFMLCLSAFYFGGWSLSLKASLFYLPLWATVEFFHWVQMRELSKCKVCHFDPILYKKNWKEARRLVEERLSHIKNQVEEKRKTNSSQATGQVLNQVTKEAALNVRAAEAPSKSP